MADGGLPGSLSPRLHLDPRHAPRAGLRPAMGNADEGHWAHGLDDRAEVRDRQRKARPQQAPVKTDNRSLRAPATPGTAAEPFLNGSRDVGANNCVARFRWVGF